MEPAAAAAAAAKLLQLCLTPCNPIDSSPPGSPALGILQARILEWVAISFFNAWKWKVKVKSFSPVLTLSDPMDGSLPGSSIHGIYQARALKAGIWDLAIPLTTSTKIFFSISFSVLTYKIISIIIFTLLGCLKPKCIRSDM